MKNYLLYDNNGTSTITLPLDELVGKYEKLGVSAIQLDSKMIFGDINFIYNDYNHPTCFTSFMKEPSVLINEEYYKQNKDYVINSVIDMIKKHSGNLSIYSSDLITKDVILAIASNPNITSVKLGTLSDIYKLTKEDYDILNNGIIKGIDTEAVSEELDNNFDGIIYYNMTKKLIDNYNYSQVTNNTSMFISNVLSQKELQYFSLAKEDLKIYFSSKNYADIINNIEYLEKMGKNFKYVIKVDNKQEFNKCIFSRTDLPSSISIEVGAEVHSVDRYLKYEKMLYEMIEPAQSLSPFEKFLYAYNIVKKFKSYKESSTNVFESRNLYDVLSNDYMVCVGYSAMLCDLLDKLGISAMRYSLDVDTGFDKIDPQLEEMPINNMSKKEGHSRVIVNLVDEKYGINGIYQSDPTWDNILDNDSYAYALMTFKEASKGRRYLYQDQSEVQMFDSSSIEEFYYIINNYLDSLVRKDKDPKFAEANARKSAINKILKLLSKLDNGFYQKLLEKYKDINSYKTEISDLMLSSFMYNVGSYITSKIQNPISVNKYKEAIRVLYFSIYDLEADEIEKLVNETIDYNKQRFERAFPTTYKISQDGSKEIYSSLENKFSIEPETDGEKHL